jgi:DNA-binding SARP family transcriptional activator
MSLLGEGRHRLLDSWLTALPDAVLDGEPWLLYLAGSCRTFSDPDRGRETLERALGGFRGQGDPAGTYLAWSGIVETYLHRWGDLSPLDRWIDLLDELLAEHPALPSPQVEARVVSSQFMALVLCRPDHPRYDQWERRAREIFDTAPGLRERLALGSRLALRFNWWGAQAASSVLADELRPLADGPGAGPLAKLLWHFVESMHLWLAADHKGCLATVETGLTLADESGIHLVDGMLTSMGVYAALLEGDFARAEALLARKRKVTDPSRALEHSHVHNLQGWAAMLRGETAKAAEHAEIATRLAAGAGVPFIEATFCLSSTHALTELGDLLTAGTRLERAREVKERVRSRYLDFGFHLAEAHLAFARDDGETGTEALRKAFGIGRREGYGNTAWWLPDVLARLCATALEEEIEPDYVAGLIRRRGLSLRSPPVELESWPWPLRIFTLGRFDIVRRFAPVRFSGKAQSKPLELLKVLIALKGRNVPAQQIKEILWPDAIGDSDHHALEMNLHRLRKLLGAAEAVRYSEGKLTLDASHCWVDAWALERLITRLERALARAGPPEAGQVERLLRRIVKLYQGPFLAQEGDPWWAAGMQSRLKERYTGAVCHAGRFWEDRGAWDRAITAYQDGLRADALSEELYRRLITGYGKLGRRAEAQATYLRCHAALQGSLGLDPSAETKTVLKQALMD